jgi:hypothetical protein
MAIDHAEVARGEVLEGSVPPERVATSVSLLFPGRGVRHFAQLAAVGGFSA